MKKEREKDESRPGGVGIFYELTRKKRIHPFLKKEGGKQYKVERRGVVSAKGRTLEKKKESAGRKGASKRKGTIRI